MCWNSSQTCLFLVSFRQFTVRWKVKPCNPLVWYSFTVCLFLLFCSFWPFFYVNVHIMNSAPLVHKIILPWGSFFLLISGQCIPLLLVHFLVKEKDLEFQVRKTRFKFHFQGIVSLNTVLTYRGLPLEPSSTVKLKILLVPKCIFHFPNSIPLFPSFSEPARPLPPLSFCLVGLPTATQMHERKYILFF